MRITVLITSYNRESWIQKCIESALNQDYPADLLTVAVIDDQSPDNSWQVICKTLYGDENAPHRLIQNGLEVRDGKTGKGVRVVSVRPPKNTGGPSSARNILVELLKDQTDAFQILDCDDEMLPSKVSKLAEYLSLSEGVGAVYADYYIRDEDTGLTRVELKRPFSQTLLGVDNCVHSGSLVSKRALVAVADQFGYFDHGMRTCEDYDLWIRLSERFTILHVAEPLTMVRNHKGNSTHTVPKELWQRNWQRIREKITMRANVRNQNLQRKA